MYISIDKQPIRFQNFFDIQSRLCQGKGQKTFSHFKYLHDQHNNVSRVTSCLRATRCMGLVCNIHVTLKPRFQLIVLINGVIFLRCVHRAF